MESQVTPKNLRKRKALLVLPLLVIPFLTMAFWALGGGKNNNVLLQPQEEGLILELPSAQLKEDKEANKLRFYEAAERDSAKMNELLKNDPYYTLPSIPDTSLSGFSKIQAITFNPAPLNTGDYKDPNEEKVYRKLAELNQELSQVSAPSSKTGESKNLLLEDKSSVIASEDVDRLENMMQNLKTSDTHDPELIQLNQMMERILDIQHPERVKQRFQQRRDEEKEQALDVAVQIRSASFSLLDTSKNLDEVMNGEGFYSLPKANTSGAQNAIEAIVHQSQEIVSGAVVKLRLTSDLSVGNQLIPKGSFVFGVATLNNERLEVRINSVRHDNSLFPVKLEVFDIDGLPGIYIPGAISRDVAKGSFDNAAQGLEIASLDPSLKAQAASAGLGAVKTFLSKKAKLVRVYLKAGYRVLLRDKNFNP